MPPYSYWAVVSFNKGLNLGWGFTCVSMDTLWILRLNTSEIFPTYHLAFLFLYLQDFDDKNVINFFMLITFNIKKDILELILKPQPQELQGN